jgi:hypothetical protein
MGDKFELTPDGVLRQNGKVIDLPAESDLTIDLRLLGQYDADAEAARLFMRIAQTPVQAGTPGPQPV